MDPVTAKLMSAAGAAADPVYVDDVFSTFLYDGTGAAQTITNGIDLSGEGGLVWLKSRNNAYDHRLTDTERGLGKALESNSTDAEATTAHCVNGSFNSDGFSLSSTGTPSAVNTSGDDICSWTFRKCPGFFDVVTWTGDGTSGRTISHNLGSVPGAIFIKQTNSSRDWCVYHRGVDATNPSHYKLHLNKNDARADEANIFNDTEPTSTVFTVGHDGEVNGNGDTYVAYLFAHDDQSFGDDGDESIIKCGSFTASSGSPHTVTVGFEPQWVIIKRTATNIGNWTIIDNMRGWMADTSSDGTIRLLADENNAEDGVADMSGLTSTGFTVDDGAITYGSNQNYIYIAIRRPHKPPSAGTDVLAQKLIAGSTTTQTVSVSGAGVTDMTIIKNCTSASHPWITASRLLGNGETKMNYANAESTGTFGTAINLWDQMSGTELRYDIDINRNGYFYMHWQFTRKPGVFDVVAYTGTGSAQNISHNLGVAPELIITKRRDSASSLGWITGSYHWFVSTRWDRQGRLNQNSYGFTGGGIYEPASSHSATQYPVNTDGDVNASGGTYFSFLFATLPGISKVGTYSGTGNNIDVDCGFTAGARFVLIKRADSSGDCFVFDTERGINSGNDSYLIVNSQANPVTNQDYIDPLNAGFTITSSAPAGLNASGGTYIFLAIA